jgi:hypothetical protein
VVLHATWFENGELYHDEWLAGVRLEVPLGENWKDAFKPRRRHLAERLFEPVHRKNNSITTSGQEEEEIDSKTTTTTTTTSSQSNTQNNLGPSSQEEQER